MELWKLIFIWNIRFFHVFTATFDAFNAPLLNKSINLLKEGNNPTYPKPTNMHQHHPLGLNSVQRYAFWMG